MDIMSEKIFSGYVIKSKNAHLHSREHLLADDISRQMLEPKRFGAYLGIARLYEESDLRALARRIVEKEDLPPEARGKYFFACLRGLVKKSIQDTSKNEKENETANRNNKK